MNKNMYQFRHEKVLILKKKFTKIGYLLDFNKIFSNLKKKI